MQLSVLGSSSSGNGYILHNDNEALLIEAGVLFCNVQKALQYETKKIVGCIITHAHGDHFKYAKEYLKRGIKIYGNREVVSLLDAYGAVEITSKRPFASGNFKIMPFDVIHDVQTFGYIISHPETGNIIFITDSAYSPYKFKNINHAIVEANYITEIVQDRINAGVLEPWRLARLQASHMSLETCKQLLQANDLSKCDNIILIHLSQHNSDHIRIKKEIEEEFHKPTYIATKGLTIELNHYDHRPNF